MTDEIVQQTIVSAVQKAYDAWAIEHPSLAAVIDRIALTQQTVESLRESEQYREALRAYHEGLSELDFLKKLTELATPIITALLAG
jgi:histidinol-phosphate/aromatic aminotransferase/cobyric acid decarboxylase-like protein